MIQVGHISSAPFTGGAARAGYRLHQGLLAEGNSSVWWDASGTAPPTADIRRIEQPRRPRGLRSRWERWLGRDHTRRLKRVFARSDTYHSWPAGWGRLEHFRGPEAPTIWNLHWVGGFLHWASLLPALTERAPVVWTLHDLNPMRGVWHYEPFADERSARRDEWERRAMEIKHRALESISKDRLVFAAPSHWIAEECRRSPLTCRFETVQIPYGLPEQVYRPLPKELARTALGLPLDGALIGFVADSVADRRKGMRELGEALKLLPNSVQVRLLTAGSGTIPEDRLERIHLGPLRDDRLMRLFYSACDLFVCPSLQDNLPNTVLEAMACGTPAAGFSLGGLPDMIRPDETGLLVSPGDVGALAAALRRALSDREALLRMGDASRRRVEREYPLGLQARRYHDLYRRFVRG